MTAGAPGVDGPGAGSVAAGHELLVRLAGRLPDDLLWRLRDWLAAGAHDSVDAVLPRALLRHRLGLTDHERDLLALCVDERSPSRRLVDAILPLAELDDPWTAFAAGHGLPDLAALSATSVVAGHPGVEELRQSLRGPHGEQRVLLVLGAERPWDLTATLQRLLRVHGDRTPCVEVLSIEMEVPAYHQAAFLGSATLWAAPAHPADAVPAPGQEAGAPATEIPSGALTGT
ncbi:hypothetical protein EV383_6031 [Pseudonocardia sediminis]|uniref:Uncharacterized protein n=1 Tax=Pseudonocardia sediminis TaxID=1397368 RepID=A0A4Q7V6F1_PSEST|nr:hypothetical protein [Pseudonocardia sediminis]RZT89074.1 hypothetical protein EV383_6031 [Pseudonocardia sediminis]